MRTTWRLRLKHGVDVVKEIFRRWRRHDVLRLAAALSYYTAFSLAPLLLLVVAVVGLAFGRDAAEGKIVGQLAGLLGTKSAQTIQSMLAAAWQPTKGIVSAAVSVIAVLIGATGVLSELKAGLNLIMQSQEPGGIEAMVKERVKFLGLILAIGFILMVSLAISAGLSAAGDVAAEFLPLPNVILHGLEIIVSLSVLTIVFAVLFRYLPNRQLPWRSIWGGSLVTATFFAVGKMAFGLYLGKSAVASSYGAAGSVLIVLLWVYYSSIIFYTGAEFTTMLAEPRKSSRVHR